MDNSRPYRFLLISAVTLTLLWVGWTIYDGLLRETVPGNHAYASAERMFEDADYETALGEFDEVLREHPLHTGAMRGRARTLLQMERFDDSLASFNASIVQQPEVAVSYANRGILHDRVGRHALALADYEKALSLDPEIGEGPGWLTRFMRNQSQKQPGIADRLQYLKAQMALPEQERRLSRPEVDAQQRSFKP